MKSELGIILLGARKASWAACVLWQRCTAQAEAHVKKAGQHPCFIYIYLFNFAGGTTLQLVPPVLLPYKTPESWGIIYSAVRNCYSTVCLVG